MQYAVILVLCGSVAHAIWNLLASRVAGGEATLFVWVYSLISLVFLLPAAYVAWRLGGAISWSLMGASVVSALCHTAYSLALQVAYARADVNVTYPVARGVGPVFVAVAAVALWHEQLGWPGWLGIALVTTGVGVVSTGRHARLDRARQVKGVRWGLLVAVTIASYTLWDAHAVTTLELDPVLYYAGTGLSMAVMLSASCARRWRAAVPVLTQHLPTAVTVAALVPLAYILVLVAMTMAPVSVVAPLRSTSIVIGSLAAWIWLDEPNGGRRLLGAGVVMAGVVALVTT